MCTSTDAELQHSPYDTVEVIELDSVQGKTFLIGPSDTYCLLCLIYHINIYLLTTWTFHAENRHPVRQQQRQRVSKTATSTRSTSNSGIILN